jgi:hypothetical protein
MATIFKIHQRMLNLFNNLHAVKTKQNKIMNSFLSFLVSDINFIFLKVNSTDTRQLHDFLFDQSFSEMEMNIKLFCLQ